MNYELSYREKHNLNESDLTDAQRTLHYIAENMRMQKSISEDGYKDFQQAIKALEQQPCEDAISRKDMLAIFRQSNSLSQAWNGFEKLPPVTPKSKSEYEHDHEVVKAYNDGQAYILDKIKAEVGLLGKDYLGCPQPQVVCDDVIKIIDKYRGDTDGNS